MKSHIRQIDPVEVTVNETQFYIYPFGAFKANNILAELSSVIMPLLGAFAPLFLTGDEDGGALDTDVSDMAPGITKAFSTLSGDKLERLFKKLLTDNRNVSVDLEGAEEAIWLNADIADELFCGNAQGMYVLAFHVVKVNFSGFFEKAAGPSGKAIGQLAARMGLSDTDASTPISSPI